MPQMGPLPWVGLWITTLSLVMIFLILIFYSSYYIVSVKNFISMKQQYKWKW